MRISRLSMLAVLTQCACVSTVVQIEVGGSSSCAVRSDGSVWCWGIDHLGGGTERCQIAEEAPLCHRVPTRVEDLPAAKSVSMGESLTCALTRSDEVYCWGEGWDEAEPVEPARVPELEDVAFVAAAHRHACAVRHDGTIWCWGSEHFFGLDGEVPMQMPGPAGVTELAVRAQKICAVTATSSVSCWGFNGEDGDISTSLGEWVKRPTRIAELGSAAHVATFKHRTCAVRRDGTVRCGAGKGVEWIERTLNGLGPLAVIERDAVLTAAGEVWCVPNNRSVPAERVGTGAVQLAVDEFHYCFLTEDHRVFCGGNNEYAQLGAGDTEPSYEPREVIWP